MATKIITHRGLEPDKAGYHAESSVEAFEDQLKRGFGIEFDIQLTSDKVMIAFHDSSLARVTNNKDRRKISEIPSQEILSMDFNGSRLTTFSNVLSMILKSQAEDAVSALHLKHFLQEKKIIDQIINEIQASGIWTHQFMIFDVKPEMAKYIKSKFSGLQLAASVADIYDIERYNSVVGGTLISTQELVTNKDVYSWAWLDEWDLLGPGGKKQLVTQKTFDSLRECGFLIALVTPELHAQSPGLLGGEAHEDGVDRNKLFARFKEIMKLEPDAVCTDYPEEWKRILN